MTWLVTRIMETYADLDQRILSFQLKSGLRCLSGCGGACCTKAEVEASVLEMLPAAAEILRRGEADVWLEKTANQTRCVFYQSDPGPDAPGHCTFYPWRPPLCRMFGFASVTTKTGERAFSACKRVKAALPDTVKRAAESVADAPCFSDAEALVRGLDPSLGTHLLPVNQALEKAILRLGLALRMSHAESLGKQTAA